MNDRWSADNGFKGHLHLLQDLLLHPVEKSSWSHDKKKGRKTIEAINVDRNNWPHCRCHKDKGKGFVVQKHVDNIMIM